MPRTSSSNSDVTTLISDFATKLTDTIRRDVLDRIRGALGGDIPIPFTVRRGPGRPKGSKNKPRAVSAAKPAKKGGKRTPEALEQLGADLLAHVKANPGQRGEQIAAALKTDVGTMRLPMQKLIAAKQVRTEGQRRGTMYFAGAGGKPRAKATRKKRVARKARRKASRKPAPTTRQIARRAPAGEHGVLIPRPRPAVASKPSLPVASKAGPARPPVSPKSATKPTAAPTPPVGAATP